MSTPKHRKQHIHRIQGGGSSHSPHRSIRAAKLTAAERALNERRRKILTVMSWLSLTFSLIGLVIAFIPAGFVVSVGLFLVPGFVLGLLALALRSDRVWAAVAGVVLSVIGGQVSVVSLALVVVLVGGGISLPSFDLASLTKGFNLAGLQLPNFKLPSFKLPKVGGFGSPSKTSFSNFTKSTKDKTTKNGKTSPTPSPIPDAGPEPDPVFPTLFALNEVVTTTSGIMFSIVGFECGYDSISTEYGIITPNGQYCEAHVLLVNNGSQNVSVDTMSFIAIDNEEQVLAGDLVSGFWRVDGNGSPLEESLVGEDGESIGPKLRDPLTLSPGEHAVGVISFDVELSQNPQFLHVEGGFMTDAVLISLEG